MPLVYPSFAENYIRLAVGNNPLEVFQQHQSAIHPFIHSIPAEKAAFRYAPEKWSVQEVIQHLTDTERVFSYRLLCIIRGETATLAPFDQDQFVLATRTFPASWQHTILEWESVRNATGYLLDCIQEQTWENQIQVGDYTINARSIGLMLTGHILHHKIILQERYVC
jgi:hypothetical protein